MRSTRPRTVGVTFAGVALLLQACSTPAEQPSSGAPAPTAGTASADSGSTAAPESTATTSGSESGSGSGAESASVDDILAGKRKALIHIAEDDKDWSATYEGPIAIGDGTDDGALFRIVPAGGDKHLIEALRPREEGGRWCAIAKTNDGTDPTSVGTAKCTENQDTLFTISATGEKDEKGRPTHQIVSERHGVLQVKNDGSALYLQQVGDGGSRGTYSFVDRGAVD